MNREELIRLAVVNGKDGESIVRQPNQLNGVDMNFSEISNCKIWVCDRTSQIIMDNIKNSSIIIGPCEGSVFIRDCIDCEFRIIAKQLRTRDCKDCNIFLHIPVQPVVESSSNLRFGKWNVSYPQLRSQFKTAGFDFDSENKWNDIYDFTEEEGENKPEDEEEDGEGGNESKKGKHFSLIPEEEITSQTMKLSENDLDGKFGEPENIYEKEEDDEDEEKEEKEEKDVADVDDVELKVEEVVKGKPMIKKPEKKKWKCQIL